MRRGPPSENLKIWLDAGAGVIQQAESVAVCKTRRPPDYATTVRGTPIVENVLFPSRSDLPVMRLDGFSGSDLIFLPELRVSAAEASLATLVLNDAADIRARLRRGNEWSAMVSATFIVDDAESLRVTELQYHPMAPPLESPYDDNDFEFIELENLEFDALNLTGVRLSGAARRHWRGINLDIPLSCGPSACVGSAVLPDRRLRGAVRSLSTLNSLRVG